MNIPFRLNLEQQKKRAKALLSEFKKSKELNAQHEEAVSRFEKHHPKLHYKEATLADFSAKLADAQLVIARELGCKTWSQLKNHILLMDEIRDKLDKNDNAWDEPENCLHIRCGSDIQKTLPQAGFHGDFLEFSDPLCTGPVHYDYQVDARADFLSRSYGKTIGRDYARILRELTESYSILQASSNEYEHVVLWFEHDSYDQFILIFLLSQFHRFGLPKNLWMVTTNQFPGSKRFIGLGQLPPEGLRLLWQTKQTVTAQQCLDADLHWAAFTDPKKEVFHQYIDNLQVVSLPYFKAAALRQIQEQPIKKGELTLTEKITLELLLGESPQKAGSLFGKITQEKEPMPFLGDIMYWQILQEMEEKGHVKLAEEVDNWPDSLVSLK